MERVIGKGRKKVEMFGKGHWGVGKRWSCLEGWKGRERWVSSGFDPSNHITVQLETRKIK